VVFLLVWPAVTAAFATLHALLAAALLGPSATQLRLAQLEQTRRATVVDADRRLRRLERDLHDGTQAQLTTVAIKLGDAVDRLQRHEQPDSDTISLLRTAHDLTRQTLADVREVARGAHPADLDRGLHPALASLAESLPVPVDLDIHLDGDRLPAAAESIAYYCTLELVANALKHAAPTRLQIAATRDPHTLTVTITDDGSGGAEIPSIEPSAGSGLGGLVDRLAPVDGTQNIDSPDGGPTTARFRIPLHTLTRGQP
jgi:signal transduction histidine kinase